MTDTIVLTTGGTGGHIFPAIATAEALRKLVPAARLIFIGATYGPEERLAKEAGIPFVGLSGRGILGRGARALPALWDNFRALCQAVGIMREYSPCVVAAFGGYACFAPAFAALINGYPLLLHEQNSIGGTSVRLLSRWAKCTCVSLPNTRGLAGKTVLTGNPVRQRICTVSSENKEQGKKLLILGGSQGSHAINEAVIGILPSLAAAGIMLRHQSGSKDYERVRAAYENSGYAPECVSPFIDDMQAAYQWANLALCRSGASTVAELCIARLPAILVPFPAAIHDHQTMNARVLSDSGAAVLLPETELTGLKDTILDLLDSPARMEEMAKASGTLATPEAAQNVAREILRLCNPKSLKTHEKQD